MVASPVPVSGSGSTVEVSVMPVGSGTVGLLPINGYPSLPDGAAADASPGCRGKPKCGAAFSTGARLGGGSKSSSAPAVGGGAESGERPAPATGWAWACHCQIQIVCSVGHEQNSWPRDKRQPRSGEERVPEITLASLAAPADRGSRNAMAAAVPRRWSRVQPPPPCRFSIISSLLLVALTPSPRLPSTQCRQMRGVWTVESGPWERMTNVACDCPGFIY